MKLDELIAHAEPALGAPVSYDAIPAPIRLLAPLLVRRNGFYAYHSALLVRAVGSRFPLDIASWNEPGAWVGLFGDAARGLIFFAEDVFGGQFGVDDAGAVWTFDPETCDRDVFAQDVEGFAAKVLAEPDVVTGYVLARAWQRAHGVLGPDRRLIPRRPFVLGGDYTLENLQEVDAIRGMRARAGLARQLHDLPDGTRVRVKVED